MIAILLPDLRGGGAERVMIDLAKALDQRGHAVEFVLMNRRGAFLPEAEAAFSVVDLGAPRIRHAWPSLARYLRSRNPKAMIANMWPLTSVAAAAKLRARYRGRLLLVEHNTLSKEYAKAGAAHAAVLSLSTMIGYRLADGVAAVSKGAADDVGRLGRMGMGRVHVLPNPVPQRAIPDDAALAAADRLWGVPRGSRILTVGSFKDQKNHPLLLQSFAALSLPDARLMLLGTGPREPDLRAQVRALGLADRVIFAGFHPDPSAFYATADLFALSSDYEGLPTVLIEALSFGLPIVSTDCRSGPAEILAGGRFGTLVPVGDARALSQAMAQGLTAPVDRAALKNRSADFSPDIAAQAYLDLLGLT